MANYCEIPDCDRPTRSGRLCDMHEKRKQRGQDLSAPVQERLTPKQRALEHGIKMLEADSDEEYNAHEKAWLLACKALGTGAASGEVIKQAMASARRRGVRLGRPPAIDRGAATLAVEMMGSKRAAARLLGVSRATLYEALGGVRKCDISGQSTDAGPGLKGGSR